MHSVPDKALVSGSSNCAMICRVGFEWTSIRPTIWRKIVNQAYDYISMNRSHRISYLELYLLNVHQNTLRTLSAMISSIILLRGAKFEHVC